MSNSSSSGSNSPYEQGEVKSSPETYKPSTKRKVVVTTSKERQTVTSPHPKDIIITKKVSNEDVIEIQSDEGEFERDTLTIKPPQSQAGPIHREKSHKHKHKREKSRDKQKIVRDKEREREPGSLYAGYRGDHHGSRGERAEVKDRIGRGVKDTRDLERERQKKEDKRQKELVRDDWAREPKNPEKEARKRKQSEKERERLENMEREKQRERRLREERERADKQRRKEEERRMQQRAEGETTYDTYESEFVYSAGEMRRDKLGRGGHHGDRSTDRERGRGTEKGERERERNSRKEQKRQRSERDRSDLRESRDKLRKDDSNRGGPKGGRTLNEHESHQEEGHEGSRSEEEEAKQYEDAMEEGDDEDVPEPPAPRPNVRPDMIDSDDDIMKSPEAGKNSSTSDNSDSDSDKSSSSDTDKKRPAKSKFDENETSDEEVEDDSDDEERKVKAKLSMQSLSEAVGQYVQDSPPRSPSEEIKRLPPYLPAIQGCRSVEEFHCLNRIEEGTFGVVYRARDKKTNEIVALKRLKMEKEKEGFPITSLREINTLLKSQHNNIVTVREIVVGSNMDKIYIVMDYVEHDLKSLMETMRAPFLIGEVKTLMKQLCRAVAHLHDNWILHRDLKTSNLLLSHKGILKVGDFGLAREYGSPLKQYTPIVVTLWYRAPELLLGTKEYSKPIDMWSVGCIYAELLIWKALWPGKSEIDQLHRIFKDLGTPTEKIWEGVSELSVFKKCTFPQHSFNNLRDRFGSRLTNLGFDLINRMLTYNPKLRIEASKAVEHTWFEESPLPVDPSMFPTWPARSEQATKKLGHMSSPKPPSGGKAYAKLLDDDERLAAGFHMDTAAKGASSQGPGFQLKF